MLQTYRLMLVSDYRYLQFPSNVVEYVCISILIGGQAKCL